VGRFEESEEFLATRARSLAPLVKARGLRDDPYGGRSQPSKYPISEIRLLQIFLLGFLYNLVLNLRSETWHQSLAQ